jgi:hypothetical protein
VLPHYLTGDNVTCLPLQLKRSSEAALLDATIFTSMQFFFNRSTGLRVVLNFVSCLRQGLPLDAKIHAQYFSAM